MRDETIICSSGTLTGPGERELPDFQEESDEEYPDEDEYREDDVDENGIPYL